MNVEVRGIRENEFAECLDLWKTVWPDDGPGYFERYFYGDPEYHPEYTRVALLDGSIVSAVQVVKRTISCGDCTLTLGGIANVATHPDYRGHGYAQACLRQAVEVMESDAIDLSVLFTGIHGFYSACGYEPVTGSRLLGELRPEPLHPFTRMVVRPYEDRDDACIHLIHIAYNRERPITVRRTAPYWRDWIGWRRGEAPGRATVAEHEGVVVGYCLYTVDEEKGLVRVREFGVRDGAEQALDALLEEAAETARAHHVPSMSIPLHEDPAVEEVSARLFVNKEVEPTHSAMVRFLHRDNLLHGLSAVLTERWHRVGAPQGCLQFSGNYGAVELRGTGPFLQIAKTESADGALSQAQLFDLLVGRGLPKETLLHDDMRFANALFPARYPWFWELDGF